MQKALRLVFFATPFRALYENLLPTRRDTAVPPSDTFNGVFPSNFARDLSSPSMNAESRL
jgi:hypothetical protein